MAKIIKNFNIDLSSVATGGVTRQFKISGDSGAIFSLEVKNEDEYYYNFKTKTFAAAESKLKQKVIPNNGVYSDSISFPVVTDDDHYDIYLYAESNYDTIHASYKEVRFADDSIDINSSTGSNSNVLKKVLYQYADVVVTLSAVAPTTYRSTTDFTSMVVSTDTFTLGRGKATSGKRAFEVGVTVAATKAMQLTSQPTGNDLTAFTTAVFGDPVTIPGEDIWAGTARSTDTTNGAAEASTTVTMDVAVASKMKVGDRVTGTGISSASTVTVSSLSGTYTFVASEAVTISDGVTLTFTPPYYYRWSVVSTSSTHKLASGMTYLDPDWPDVPLTTISAYRDTTTYTTEVHNEDGSVSEVENTVVNTVIPAIDPLGFKPTIEKGVVTKQLGNITFASQIIDDVDDTNNKYFYSYGPRMIEKIHNTKVKLTDVKVELLAPTTTTTEATSASKTIAVTDREGVINNVSTVNGVNINASASRGFDTVDGAVSSATKIVLDNNGAGQMNDGDRVTGKGIPSSSIVTVVTLNPDADNVKEFSVSEPVSINDGVTLTFTPQALPTITSGGGADGAGDWVLSTPQSFENGTILTVGGTSRRAKITGYLEFIDIDDTSFTLYFDVERFLTAS